MSSTLQKKDAFLCIVSSTVHARFTLLVLNASVGISQDPPRRLLCFVLENPVSQSCSSLVFCKIFRLILFSQKSPAFRPRSHPIKRNIRVNSGNTMKIRWIIAVWANNNLLILVAGVLLDCVFSCRLLLAIPTPFSRREQVGKCTSIMYSGGGLKYAGPSSACLETCNLSRMPMLVKVTRINIFICQSASFARRVGIDYYDCCWLKLEELVRDQKMSGPRFSIRAFF